MTALLSMEALRDRVGALSTKLAGPGADLPIGLGESSQDGTPHIEIDDAYHYVMCERGTEFGRRSTTDLDEILYWIARDVTFWRAVDHELHNRIEGQDCRRILFQHQRELMAAFGAEWSSRLDLELAATLAAHPFGDDNGESRDRHTRD
jgi:hypothetical protein